MCASALSAQLSRSSASPCLNSLNASVSVMATSSAAPAELVACSGNTPLCRGLHVLNFHNLKVWQEIRRKFDGHTAEEPADACFFEKRCEKGSHCRHHHFRRKRVMKST